MNEYRALLLELGPNDAEVFVFNGDGIEGEEFTIPAYHFHRLRMEVGDRLWIVLSEGYRAFRLEERESCTHINRTGRCPIF